MKRKIFISSLLMTFIFLLFLTACKKKESDDNNNNNLVPPITTVTDVDGNVYDIITIGTQTWMAENLKVTHYRNGDPIQHVVVFSDWINLTTGAYCDYDNDPANGNSYGHLYNWYAAIDDRGIAPVGWHVPTKADWQTLMDNLGGDTIAGGKLKSTTLWITPNTGATNSSGFNGLPSGYRDHTLDFTALLFTSGHWSINEAGTYQGYCMFLWHNKKYTSSSCAAYKIDGLSIRCVKD